MSERVRLAVLALLLLTGAGLAAAVSVSRVRTPLPSSLVPAFTLLGRPVQAIDHLTTRIMPVGNLDEQALGDVLRLQLDGSHPADDPDASYVNGVLRRLTVFAGKPFDYRVYMIDWGVPNALALPGGVIFVTRSLLDVLRSEAELAAVLAHELGHIELGHCMDAVRFRLLTEKLGQPTLGELMDFAAHVLVGHSYGKTQEEAADDYSFAVLARSPYDPRGVGRAFESLLEYVHSTHPQPGTPPGANPLRDYFMSHPPLELRAATYRDRARVWWHRNPDATRVTGEVELRHRVSSDSARASPP
jgi:beta-barrel assembly-enhancing protease